MRNQAEIMKIMHINVHSFANVNYNNFLVNLEGHVCKSTIVLTKPPDSTPTYTTHNTYSYNALTLYMSNLNVYVSEA